MKQYIMIMTVVLTGLWTTGLTAQHRIKRDVFANSTTTNASGSHRLNGTVGQLTIGKMDATSGLLKSGFWPSVAGNDSTLNIVNLPEALGAATAEIWNDRVYLFGGGNHWWPNAVTNKVYRLDNDQWSIYDSIPDNNTWGVESTIIGDEVYLLGGYSSGSRLTRKFDISAGSWRNLPNSPNTGHWGNTIQVVGENLYLFNVGGLVFQYSFADSSWTAKTRNDTITYEGLRSVVYQDEIYLLGYRNNRLNKYNPQNDQWTELAPPPYPVVSCAMEILNGKIYCIGGSLDGGPGPSYVYRSVISYDLSSGAWSTENLEISSGRIWMASAVYQDQIYVFGGFDSLGVAVDIVESLRPPAITSIDDPGEPEVPSQFHLRQNYPNPFNPTTTIEFALPAASVVTLQIYDILGRHVDTPYRAYLQPAGSYKFTWDATDAAGKSVASGMYFYRLQAGSFVATKKMLLVR